MLDKPKRLRKTGTLEDAKRELWRAVLCARSVLMHAETGPELTLKAVHAVQQSISAYLRLLEAADLHEQVQELQARLDALTEQAGRTLTKPSKGGGR
ncbi:MAG: hypothetical protein RhofKO_19630 [Rhodothermales bacterium]